MYDPVLHLVSDDPPVVSGAFVVSEGTDLRRPPPAAGLDAAAWAAVRAHQGVWVNGRLAGDRAPAGAQVQWYGFAGALGSLDGVPLKVLWDEGGVVAVDKPAGLSTQRTRVSALRCLEALLVERLRAPGLRAVHRLDRGTSGVVLFARDGATAAALHAEFRGRTVEKEYLAGVAPPPAEVRFEVAAALQRAASPGGGRPVLRFEVGAGAEARPSLTRFERVAVHMGRALVVARPVTGRTHQIRVHLAHVGCPILGDDLYGDALSAPRLMLHAAALRLRVGGAPRVFSAAAPEGLRACAG